MTKHLAPLYELPEGMEWNGEYVVYLNNPWKYGEREKAVKKYQDHIDWVCQQPGSVVETPKGGIIPSIYHGKFSQDTIEKIRSAELVTEVSKLSKCRIKYI